MLAAGLSIGHLLYSGTDHEILTFYGMAGAVLVQDTPKFKRLWGALIKVLREKKGWDVMKLASRAEVAEFTIRRVESGQTERHRPSRQRSAAYSTSVTDRSFFPIPSLPFSGILLILEARGK